MRLRSLQILALLLALATLVHADPVSISNRSRNPWRLLCKTPRFDFKVTFKNMRGEEVTRRFPALDWEDCRDNLGLKREDKAQWEAYVNDTMGDVTIMPGTLVTIEAIRRDDSPNKDSKIMEQVFMLVDVHNQQNDNRAPSKLFFGDGCLFLAVDPNKQDKKLPALKNGVGLLVREGLPEGVVSNSSDTLVVIDGDTWGEKATKDFERKLDPRNDPAMLQWETARKKAVKP